MIKVLKHGWIWAVSIITFIFMFVPEDLFKTYILFPCFSDSVNIVINRSITFLLFLILSLVIYALFLKFRTKVEIKGKNYTVIVKYGNIFKMKNCKKVIAFDECFTAKIGSEPSDINPNSICGQFLQKNPSIDIDQLVSSAGLQPKGKSQYAGKRKYESGNLIPYQDYLLMAFAKLDKDGLGRMTREEYIASLTVLWKNLDTYYGQQDVCIPIIGSGVTRIGDAQLTQQELLDIIISSYKLSLSKIQKPNKLLIVCRKRDDFSLNNINA